MKPFVADSLPLKKLKWEPLIPHIGPANRALAGFGGALLGFRNAEILLSPLTTQEAVLSSRIEGTQTTLSEVYRFEAGELPQSLEQREDIREVLNYRRAIKHAVAALAKRPFHINLLLQLHSILLDSVRGQNKARGQIRTVQNWIGVPGSPIDAARFVPPSPRDLLAALGNWELYYHADDKDALVQLAVLHAQFEILHPFLDGNGRLGRMLIPLFLFEKNVLANPVFYLSDYLEINREEYITRLNAIGRNENGWEDWIVFFLTALKQQAEANLRTASEILHLYETLKLQVIELTSSKHAVWVLDAFFERPILAASDLISRPLAPSKPTISAILSRLREGRVLKVITEARGRRPQVVMLQSLVEICEGGSVRRKGDAGASTAPVRSRTAVGGRRRPQS